MMFGPDACAAPPGVRTAPTPIDRLRVRLFDLPVKHADGEARSLQLPNIVSPLRALLGSM